MRPYSPPSGRTITAFPYVGAIGLALCVLGAVGVDVAVLVTDDLVDAKIPGLLVGNLLLIGVGVFGYIQYGFRPIRVRFDALTGDVTVEPLICGGSPVTGPFKQAELFVQRMDELDLSVRTGLHGARFGVRRSSTRYLFLRLVFTESHLPMFSSYTSRGTAATGGVFVLKRGIREKEATVLIAMMKAFMSRETLTPSALSPSTRVDDRTHEEGG